MLRTGGDEVADHHRRFQPRAGGDEKHHRQFLLQTGGDEAVQYKIPTPSSSRPQIYPTAVPTARRLLSPSRLSLQLPPSPTVVADPTRRLHSQARPPRSRRRHGCVGDRRTREGPRNGAVAATAFARRSGPVAPDPTPPEPRRATRRLGLGGAALDVFAAVLRRLDHVEIRMGPAQVYRSWRRAAHDDPKLLSEQ